MAEQVFTYKEEQGTPGWIAWLTFLATITWLAVIVPFVALVWKAAF